MLMNFRLKRFLNNLPTWAQVTLVVAVVALISLLFPTGVKFDYAYEQGQRWRYDDLVAPFDFAIRKSREELEDERLQIERAADPYFIFNAKVEQRELSTFQAAFQQQYATVRAATGFTDVRARPRRYLALGEELLSRAYRRGVAAPVPQLQSPPHGVVNVLRDGSIALRSPEQLPVVSVVRTRLADSLAASQLRDADFLVPLVQDAVQANVTYSDSLTRRITEARLEEIVPSRGMVSQGELIVTADGIVTDEVRRKLDSYRRQYESEVVDDTRGYVMLLGYFLITGLIMGVLLLYIRVFHPGEFNRFNRLMFILSLVLAASFTVTRIDAILQMSVYIMPFAVVPIIVRSFYSAGVALFTHLVVVLLATFLTGLGFDFAFLHIIAGLVAVLSPAGQRDYSQIIRSLALIAGAYGLGFLGLELVREGSWRSIDWELSLWLATGMFFTLLAYPLVPLLGRAFGFTSEVVLLELSDMNRPLLRQLAARAPGTMQHSISVGNLAEAAAREVDADALLVRVAALYHDLGKMEQPQYFIENQSGNNPHDDLDELESAKVIIAHVSSGVRIAKEAGLPQVLVDFIRSHHGTTRVEYFYRTYVQDHADETIDDRQFRYPGPRPFTREQGILMLADGIEAASRAMKEPSVEALDELVDSMTAFKVSAGQLDRCALSFADLTRCRAVFKSVLGSMYHARVEYPEEIGADAAVHDAAIEPET